MTPPPSGRRLHVDGDLRLSVDGVDATLGDRDGELTLRTDEPLRFARALQRSGAFAALRRLDDELAGPGLERPPVTVEGPRGRIARIAPDARRRVLRASPAGTRIRWYRPTDLIPGPAKWVVAAAIVAVFLLRKRGRQ